MAAHANFLSQQSTTSRYDPTIAQTSHSSNVRTKLNSNWRSEYVDFAQPSTSELIVPNSEENYAFNSSVFQTASCLSPFNNNKLSPAINCTPKCAVCKGDSTGIHFGVDSCSACAAYFRRTTYVCPRDNNCVIELDSQNRKKCRACRFARCLKAGMDKNGVQGRRDAIGKYSSIYQQQETNGCNGRCPSDCLHCKPNLTSSYHSIRIKNSSSPHRSVPSPSNGLSEEVNSAIDSPVSSTTFSIGAVLRELSTRYNELNRLRKIFYCQKSLRTVFEDTEELEPSELKDFSECMFQLWRVEPRLSVDFIGTNAFLRELPALEKTRIFSNFLLHFHAIEEPYLTWKHGGLMGDKKFWMMPNRVFLMFNRAEEYFDTPNVMKGLKLDKKSAINLFKPSFQFAMETVGEKMALMDLRQTEVIGLIGIVLFDPTCKGLLPGTVGLLARLRNQLFNDLLDYYRVEQVVEPEIRLGNLIILLQGVKVHAFKSKENMELLRIFQIAPFLDNLFEEIVGITTPK
ncbi:Nuclear Hormone Receptor family [Aphelenchoides besseyi]|nr:Nuclear Hormone Receptor family [Aphelenchoides besseyi]